MIDPTSLETLAFLGVLAVALVALGLVLFCLLTLLGGDRGKMDEEATLKDAAKLGIDPYAHMRRVRRETRTVYSFASRIKK